LVTHVLPFAFAHVPGDAARLQAVPLGQLASAQQTPSTQYNAGSHGVALLHARPRPGAGTQVVALHVKPAMQSELALHDDLHVVAPQV
jgi:hypothetical protein